MKKTVTIIISHLNDNENLFHCLENISKKPFANAIKILVQDGGSRVSPVLTLADRRLPLDIKVLVEDDCGIYDAWNKAISHIDTKYVSFLGADDRLTIDWFKQIDVAETSSANFVSGRALMRKETNLMLLGEKSYKFLWPIFMNVVHSGGIFRTDFIKNTSFDASMVVAGDYVHLLKYSKKIRCSFLDRVVVIMDGYGISQRKGDIGISEISDYLRDTSFLRSLLYKLKQTLRHLKK